MIEDLARQILKAMDIREDSFDPLTAEYSKTFAQAAAEAGETSGLDVRGNSLVHILIACAWNDAGNWAEEALNPDADDKLRDNIIKWMIGHLIKARIEGLDDLVNMHGIGEVNMNILANEAAHQSGLIASPHAALALENGPLWDAAVDAANWFERKYDDV